MMFKTNSLNPKNTLGKSERLKSKTELEALFKEGDSLRSGPFIFLWKWNESNAASLVQVAFSVPKKNFKNATDRNLMKRRIRESYRVNKAGIFEAMHELGKQLALFIIFRNPEPLEYDEVHDKIIVALKRLEKEIERKLGDE